MRNNTRDGQSHNQQTRPRQAERVCLLMMLAWTINFNLSALVETLIKEAPGSDAIEGLRGLTAHVAPLKRRHPFKT
jgi:hypothetical protein